MFANHDTYFVLDNDEDVFEQVRQYVEEDAIAYTRKSVDGTKMIVQLKIALTEIPNIFIGVTSYDNKTIQSEVLNTPAWIIPDEF